MGGGDGHLENGGLGLGEESPEWSFNSEVPLDSSLVFLSEERSLEGDGSMSFPDVNWVDLSLDLHISGSDSVEFNGSLEGNGNWHLEFVDNWQTEG